MFPNFRCPLIRSKLKIKLTIRASNQTLNSLSSPFPKLHNHNKIQRMTLPHKFHRRLNQPKISKKHQMRIRSLRVMERHKFRKTSLVCKKRWLLDSIQTQVYHKPRLKISQFLHPQLPQYLVVKKHNLRQIKRMKARKLSHKIPQLQYLSSQFLRLNLRVITRRRLRPKQPPDFNLNKVVFNRSSPTLQSHNLS